MEAGGKFFHLGAPEAGEDVPLFFQELGNIQEVQEDVQVEVGQGQLGGRVGEVAGIAFNQQDLAPA